jgi:DNA replication and repair protein RecF
VKVKKLHVKAFRNLHELELCPADGVNVIYGENGQGKTNLLEAIWLFTGAKSFRGSKEAEFVPFDEDSAEISLDCLSDRGEISLVLNTATKRVYGITDASSAPHRSLRGQSIRWYSPPRTCPL